MWGVYSTGDVKNNPLDMEKQSFFFFLTLFFSFLVAPHGLWDLSSPIRDRTGVPDNESMVS